MGTQFIRNGLARIGFALVLSALLSACLISPGNFVSTMDLRKNGNFRFTYSGEISILGLTQLAEMADNQQSDDEFEPLDCVDDDGEFRPCTEEELDDQRSNWAEENAEASSSAEDPAKQEAMEALLGGMDFSDPDSADELASQLSRQKGWDRVEYKGNGLFVVDFAINSVMSHDFSFPVFESLPGANQFVRANIRDNGSVRIEAPGFSSQSATASPGMGMLQAAAAAGDSKNSDSSVAASLPELNGRFTITTDGEILANNTDEGPANVANGKQLTWEISRRTSTAPMALIRLGD